MAIIADMTLPAAGRAVLKHHQGRWISLHSVVALKATHRRFPCNKHKVKGLLFFYNMCYLWKTFPLPLPPNSSLDSFAAWLFLSIFISFCPCCHQYDLFSPAFVSITSLSHRLHFSTPIFPPPFYAPVSSHHLCFPMRTAAPCVTFGSRPAWWEPFTSSARPHPLQASSTAVMKTKQTLLIGVPDSRKLD